MDPDTRRLIEAIHCSTSKCVLVLTGGGAGAAAALLSVPGGSRTVLEVVVPYHERAFRAFLGYQPEQFCSTATSRALASRAYECAAWLAPGETVLGLGCTASLVSDRPKRGDHRFHLTVHSVQRSTTYSLILRKGEREREAEEAVLDSILLNALAEAVDLTERMPVPLLAEEMVQVESQPSADLVSLLVRGELPAFCAEPDGRLSRPLTQPSPPNSPGGRGLGEGAAPPAAVLAGAFNPAHEGHWLLASVASRILGTPVAFELSATNVDKPPPSVAETRRRLQQFTWGPPVWVTRAPTFTEKATLFPARYSSWVRTRPNASSPRAITETAKRVWPRCWSTFAGRAAVSLSPAVKIAPANISASKTWAYPTAAVIYSPAFRKPTFAFRSLPLLCASRPAQRTLLSRPSKPNKIDIDARRPKKSDRCLLGIGQGKFR